MSLRPVAALKAFAVAAILVAVTVALDAPALALYAVALAGTAAVGYFGLIGHGRSCLGRPARPSSRAPVPGRQ